MDQLRRHLCAGTALIGVLAGCGVTTTSAKANVDSLVQHAETKAALLRIDAAVYGTVDQRRKIEERIYSAYQDPIVSCMADAGFSYTPPPNWEPYAGWTSNAIPASFGALLDVETEPPPQHVLAVSHRLRVHLDFTAEVAAAPNPGFTTLAPSQQTEYLAQQSRCAPAADAYASLSDELVDPTLLEAYEQLLAAAVADDTVRKHMQRYPACLRDAGIPIDPAAEFEGGPLLAAADLTFQTLLERAPANGFDDPAYRSAVDDAQRRLSEADATCRTKAHATALDVVAESLPDFLTKWDDELVAASDRYAEATGIPG